LPWTILLTDFRKIKVCGSAASITSPPVFCQDLTIRKADVFCLEQEKSNVNLEEMKKQIEALVIAKGFYNKPEDIPKKLLFAFIELGEASDAWKKGLPEEKISEELVDVIFYILDASRLACPNMNMDEVFEKKLAKNLGRPYQYGEGHRSSQHEKTE
jgi:NTP pyrophosphatase (non-canonical NTP hydrolase)